VRSFVVLFVVFVFVALVSHFKSLPKGCVCTHVQQQGKLGKRAQHNTKNTQKNSHRVVLIVLCVCLILVEGVWCLSGAAVSCSATAAR
jgi:hypothetical protein